MKIERSIQAWASRRGYRYATGPVSLLDEVRATLQGRKKEREIEPDFFRDNLEIFTYLEGSVLENPQSIIIIAVPRPAHILTFSAGDKTIETVLPPTYVRYRKFFEEVRDDLAAAVLGFDCRLEILSAPLKALGNRLGLLSYGRNNVGYIAGIGSYFQLVGLVSDTRLDDIKVAAAPAGALLLKCKDCRICAKACPTGAIDKERILLHAEKCYTLFSESLEPIPEGLKPPSPKCLIGCLRCQQVCPENKGCLHYERASISFDAEETAAFLGLAGAPAQTMDRARAKLSMLGLTEGFPVFARNLKRLFQIWRIATPKNW
jgi:epoxyqueuosine reductase